MSERWIPIVGAGELPHTYDVKADALAEARRVCDMHEIPRSFAGARSIDLGADYLERGYREALRRGLDPLE